MKQTILLLALLLATISSSAKGVLRVLAIGNSFSEDAVEHYLWELAAAQGDTLIIGNAYIGGCEIDRHWSNAQTGKAEYRYRKIVNGHTQTQNNMPLKAIIQDERWDIVSLQQASHHSGLPYTYANLGNLKDFVIANCPNKNTEIVFHQTWAYAQNATHRAFKFYKKNQQQMYQNIILTLRDILPKCNIRRVIPSGTAIQIARKTLGDVLNRDGYHLNLSYGRYTAACTWCEFLTRKRVVGNPFRPESVDKKTALTAQKAAHKAIKSWQKHPL